MRDAIGDDAPHDKIKEYLWSTLKSGRVIPGYCSIHDLPPLIEIRTNNAFAVMAMVFFVILTHVSLRSRHSARCVPSYETVP